MRSWEWSPGQRRVARWAPGFLAFVAVGWAVVSPHTVDTALSAHAAVLFLLMLLITIGELAQVRMPTGRVTAPVSSAVAIAAASLGRVEGRPTLAVPAATIVLVVSAGLVMGQLALVVLGRSLTLTVAAARLVGVTVVACLTRSSTYGSSLWSWQQAVETPRWAAALTMVAAASAGVLVELVLSGLARAAATATPPGAALADELGVAPALTLSLVVAPPTTVLIAPVLGLLAFPLTLAPMVVTHIAVGRYVTNRETHRRTIRTLARLTEYSGHTPTAHAERVADLSVALGRRLGLVERDLRLVEYAALLHDLGQVALDSPIPGGATVLTAPHDQREIAVAGATIVGHGATMEGVASLVEQQAVPFRAVRERLEEARLPARILRVANAFDDLTGGSTAPAVVDRALERIMLGLGYEYDPEVVEALVAHCATR